MENPFTKPLSNTGKLAWEIILFVLGVAAILVVLYYMFFRPEEFARYVPETHHGRRLFLIPLLPGILLMVLSRYLQNLRTDKYDVMIPDPMPKKKNTKTYKWDE